MGRAMESETVMGKVLLKKSQGEVISRVLVLCSRRRKFNDADSDTGSRLEQVHLEPETSPAVTMSSAHDTDSTEESDAEYDSEPQSDVDICMEDDVNKLEGVDSEGNVDVERDGDDEEEEDEEEEDEADEDEVEKEN